MGTGIDVENCEDSTGIIPRAVAHLFNGIEARRKQALEDGVTPPEFKITTHFMELYNEDVIDLFEPGFRVQLFVLCFFLNLTIFAAMQLFL